MVINLRKVAIIEFIEGRHHLRYQIVVVVPMMLKEAAAAMVALLNVEIGNLSEMIVWLVDPIIIILPPRLPKIIETTKVVAMATAVAVDQ